VADPTATASSGRSTTPRSTSGSPRSSGRCSTTRASASSRPTCSTTTWSRGLADAGVPVETLDRNGTTFLPTAKANWETLADALPEDFVVFSEAPSVDERIVSQSALFSATADARTRLDERLARNAPNAVMRIVIPADCKLESRERLVQADITAKSLFPGLDGITAWLCEYYRPARATADSRPGAGLTTLDPTPALGPGPSVAP
jgi:hypothetical protein